MVSDESNINERFRTPVIETSRLKAIARYALNTLLDPSPVTLPPLGAGYTGGVERGEERVEIEGHAAQ